MPLFPRRGPDTAQFRVQMVPAGYAGRLAFIGRRLDEEDCRSVAIIEISDNYIIRAIGKTDGMPILSEIVTEDFEKGDVRLSQSLGSGSYEARLEAIGKQLDEMAAANITIIESPSAYHIVGWERGHAGGQLAYVQFERTLDRFALEKLDDGPE